MKFIANIKESFGNVTEEERDSGDLVSTIIIIAGFAVMAILAVNWLSTAVLNSAADVASCIEGSSGAQFAGSEVDHCDNNHSDTNSFEDTDGYQNRFQ